MYRLRCAVQNYEWGKPAATSIVARLKQLNALACSGVDGQPANTDADENKPYAEFWMGTHKNGPSYVLTDLDREPAQNAIELADFVASHQSALGETVLHKFSSDVDGVQTNDLVQLPFLFKVLSVNKALSIQIHPDKPNARELRNNFPNLYPDDNHKPEMAVAIGDFQCLCAFRPASEIADFLRSISELRALIGEERCLKFCAAADSAKNNFPSDKEIVSEIGATLSDCFSALMKANTNELTQALQSHINRIDEKRMTAADDSVLSAEEILVERLFRFYGIDVGCFAVYFLNAILLHDGEAVFLSANVPHCYLFGDCAEVMACSDNVVRAGLTPKYRDVATLCRLVDCTPCDPATVRFAFSESRVGLAERRSYEPPVDDFSLERYRVSKAALLDSNVHIGATHSAAIVLLLNGECVLEAMGPDSQEGTTTLFAHAGTCIFVPARTELTVKHTRNVEIYRTRPEREAFWHVDAHNVVFFRAFCKD